MTISPRSLRIAALVLPSLLAAGMTSRAENAHILDATVPVLVLLWTVMAGALVMRFCEARRPRGAASDASTPWDQLDVLTANGAATLWLGAGALVASGITGWASLTVVGLLGLGTVYVLATWTAIVAGGDVPWRRATIERSILPEVAVEGDPLREEVHISGVRIPSGMRLFATGSAHRDALVSRYAVGSEASYAELTLESELGPAMRGIHRAPRLALWLGDVLGLTRTPFVYRGEATFSVLPRPAAIEHVKKLLGSGGDDAMSRPTQRLPTEGSFRIREYVAGDDTRRIHWVRSLQQDQLVVRLPDELPHADPVVRLILDNELSCSVDCRAADELLDALVRVWLGIGKALHETGTRVTLVTAAEHAGSIAVVERQLTGPGSREAVRLGARVTWQAALPLDALLADRAAKSLIVSSRPRSVKAGSHVTWVVLPQIAWRTPSLWIPTNTSLTHGFPYGSEQNRHGRRARERHRMEIVENDQKVFGDVVCWSDWTRFSGQYLARRKNGRVALEVI